MVFGSFPIAERFVSINGEGAHAGKLAAFIRFPGCNLDCSYCDTQWARDPELTVEFVSVEELCDWVKREGVTCVTITGGEPTLQSDLYRLLHALARLETVEVVEIETNGSTDLAKLIAHDSRREEERPIALAEFPAPRPEKLCITMDYKLPSSGMEDKMFCENFELLGEHDVVKFVVGSHEDLERMAAVVREHELATRCQVYISPVFGAIEPAAIVDFMRERSLTHARLQLQLHKFIWPNQERGV